METPIMQSLMDAAYDRWEANEAWSQDRFWLDLSFPESVAVFVGNLNYQVTNGGFSQWDFNGYSDGKSQLLGVLSEIGTDTAGEVARMINRVMKASAAQPDEGGWSAQSPRDRIAEKVDDEFYAINEQLLADTEAYLLKLSKTE